MEDENEDQKSDTEEIEDNRQTNKEQSATSKNIKNKDEITILQWNMQRVALDELDRIAMHFEADLIIA